MYHYTCECCDGEVQEHQLKKEIFRHKEQFVILENVPVDICNMYTHRYYNAKLRKKAAAIAAGQHQHDRSERVPVSIV